MEDDVWESEYIDAYDNVLLNSEIYLAVRDFHVNSMDGCETVLDSGCGTGNVTTELLKRDHVVYAIDPSRKSLDKLREKCKDHDNIKIFHRSAEKLPFDKDMFDGVTSMFVVHFVDDFDGYLREHYRVLKHDGVFAITGRSSGINMEKVVESYENSLIKKGLLSELQNEMNIMRKKILNNVSKTVKHGYTSKEMQDILSDVGFRKIREFPNPYFGQCYSLTARK